MSRPTVSVIIAAYQAHDFIAEAVRSALSQDMKEIEVVVAPDEPADYALELPTDPRVRVLAGVAAPTGPGPARNRAMAAAQGRFIALLDADDLISPHYLSTLVPLAEQAGVAFGRTRITDWAGALVREVAAKGDEVGFTDFATAFASLHGVIRRQEDRRWQDVLAEDVLFDLESLALAGGRAPFAPQAVYQLRQRGQSVTRGDAFVKNIGAGYEALIAHVEKGETRVAPAQVPDVVAVWRSWAAMNARFESAVAAGDTRDYQAFAASSAGT